MSEDALGRVLIINGDTTDLYSQYTDLWHHHTVRQMSGLATCIVFLIATTATTAGRAYTRFCITRTAGVDDYAMIISQFIFLAYSTLQVLGYIYGIGDYRSQLTYDDAQQALKYFYLVFPSFALVTTCIKISLALFLLRFATRRSHKIVLHVSIVSCFIVGMAYFIFLMLMCYPYSHLWNLTPGASAHCFSSLTVRNVSYFVAAVDTVVDTFAAIIPALIVLRISMTKADKIGVFCLLGVGLLAAVATAVRIYYGISFDQREGEFVHDAAPLVLLTTIELGAGVCAANLATLRPLYNVWLRKLTGEKRNHFHGGALTQADTEAWMRSIPVGLMVVRPSTPMDAMEAPWANLRLPEQLVEPKDEIDAFDGGGGDLSSSETKVGFCFVHDEIA
ncbi:hypothetical protein K461DRAFT_318917 [Myriangium duriaei CBS 260.36]|uniref:Rhodopsin domain-containing protein n=1 Tax=Myriangium duriaei CBS 260.36 TaxID=1168546 RepID=A0A9P4MKJ8_9PEZI|nr:hypothetical protein K461DRAFT_318917 [Myriangium duriaei CBS 260.36]